jgi:hypothetical protein
VIGVVEPDIEQRRFALEVLELLGPGRAAVGAGEDLRVMAHGPAVFVIDEEHRREQLAGGHFGLGPGAALVIGIEDMPAITDRHQALAGVDHIDHQAFGGLGGLNCKHRLRGGIAGCQHGVDNATPANSESAAASNATLRAARGRQTTQPMTGSLIDLSPHLLLLGRLAFLGSETCNLERLEEAGAILSGFRIV